MCVNAIPGWTSVGVPTIGQCKGTLEALMACDMVLIFHVPLFSKWLRQVMDKGVRVQMIIDAPDDLYQLQSPPGLKEAVLHAEALYKKTTNVRVTSKAGTELTYSRGEYPVMSQYGIADEPGHFDHWGVGLLHTENISQSLMVFVIVMLSTVTFDGLMATPFWQRIENALYVAWPALGDSRLTIISTLGLLAFCAIFIAVYRLVATSIARGSKERMTPDTAGRAFVLTLVPIAIAYLIAHYLSYFLIQGQLLIRLASDPFGFGWNIFGTAHFRPDIGIVGARFVWYTSLVAIVIGHVAAVSLAHIIALRRFDDPRLAVRSQVPMLVLMVAYTMMSLWIIAQPIVE
jgi:hypothetical protein